MIDPEAYYRIETKRIEDRQKQQSIISQRQKVDPTINIGNRDSKSGLYEIKLPDGTIKTVGKKIDNTVPDNTKPIQIIPKGLISVVNGKVTLRGDVNIKTASSQESNPQKALGDQGNCQGYVAGQLFSCRVEEDQQKGNIKVLGCVVTPSEENPGRGKIEFYVFGWRKDYSVKAYEMDDVIYGNFIGANIRTDITDSGKYLNNYPIDYIGEQNNSLEDGVISLTSVVLDSDKGNNYYLTITYRQSVSFDELAYPQVGEQKITYLVVKNGNEIFKKTFSDNFIGFSGIGEGKQTKNFRCMMIAGLGYLYSRKDYSTDGSAGTQAGIFDFYYNGKQKESIQVNTNYIKPFDVFAYPGKDFSKPFTLHGVKFDPNVPGDADTYYEWRLLRTSKKGDKAIAVKHGNAFQQLVYINDSINLSNLNSSGLNYGRYWFDLIDTTITSIVHKITTLAGVKAHYIELYKDNTNAKLSDLLTKELTIRLEKRDEKLKVVSKIPAKVYPLKIELQSGQLFEVVWMSNSKKV